MRTRPAFDRCEGVTSLGILKGYYRVAEYPPLPLSPPTGDQRLDGFAADHL